MLSLSSFNTFDRPAAVENEFLADSWEKLGIVFKRDGSLNIRRTVFNIARDCSRVGDKTAVKLGGSVWGNTAFSAEQIEAVLFHYDVEEISLKQIKSALAFWTARGILRRWLSVAMGQANHN